MTFVEWVLGREPDEAMDNGAVPFRFRWQRVAPDKDDFVGTFFENEGMLARIYRIDEIWWWQVSVNGAEIGTGPVEDPRCAARAAEEAYFCAAATGTGFKRKSWNIG